jgi:hypothetical protein
VIYSIIASERPAVNKNLRDKLAKAALVVGLM